MFFVGAYTTFAGEKTASLTLVRILEKLGHSKGRATRFIEEHREKTIDGKRYRAVVFVLADSFILRNDQIQQTIRDYNKQEKLEPCSWDTAKFHIYRQNALSVVANKAEWTELIDTPKDTVLQAESGTPKDTVLQVESGTPKDVVLQAQ